MRLYRLVLAAVLAACLVPALAQGATSCLVGTAGSPASATLTFTAPTTNTDGTPITLPLTYSVYMGTSSGGETLLASGQTGSPIVITAGLKGGTSYYFYVTAVDSAGASAPSNEVCKTLAPSVPGTVTITIS